MYFTFYHIFFSFSGSICTFTNTSIHEPTAQLQNTKNCTSASIHTPFGKSSTLPQLLQKKLCEKSQAR